MFFFEYKRENPSALICKCMDRTNSYHQEIYEIKHNWFMRLVTDYQSSLLSRLNRMLSGTAIKSIGDFSPVPRDVY